MPLSFFGAPLPLPKHTMKDGDEVLDLDQWDFSGCEFPHVFYSGGDVFQLNDEQQSRCEAIRQKYLPKLTKLDKEEQDNLNRHGVLLLDDDRRVKVENKVLKELKEYLDSEIAKRTLMGVVE